MQWGTPGLEAFVGIVGVGVANDARCRLRSGPRDRAPGAVRVQCGQTLRGGIKAGLWKGGLWAGGGGRRWTRSCIASGRHEL
jgi:hypothetical protein